MTARPVTAATLTRYRVMAIITGSFLLLVCVDMLVKYGGDALFDWRNDAFIEFSAWVAIVHGWIYVIYLVTALVLWTQMRWGWKRLVTMVLGGVIPGLSFAVERTVTAEVKASVEP